MCADSKKERIVYSMTGFGQAVLDAAENRYTAEIRSINSRYSEIRVYGLRDEFSLEFELGKLIKQNFERGKFDLTLKQQANQKKKTSSQEKKIEEHFQYLKKLQKNLGLKDSLSLETVLKTLPTEPAEKEKQSDDHKQILKVVDMALQNLEISRRNEGKILVRDIQERLQLIFSSFETIGQQIVSARKRRKEELLEKIQGAIGDLPLDPQRIEGEVIMLIEKSDVSEEIVRFQKHLEFFESLIEDPKQTKKPVGRELDFMIQEMGREINTLGAKVNDVEISKMVVNIKSEMEKIREQVQNIE